MGTLVFGCDSETKSNDRDANSQIDLVKKNVVMYCRSLKQR